MEGKQTPLALLVKQKKDAVYKNDAAMPLAMLSPQNVLFFSQTVITTN